MSNRDNILNRLKQNTLSEPVKIESNVSSFVWSKDEKITQLTKCITAVHGEVHHLTNIHWIDWLNQELPKRGLKQVLIGRNKVTDEYTYKADKSVTIHHYDKPIDSWKDKLFNQIDVGLTTTVGAIAKTGSLILWPDAAEPRLLSLVPPVHIALLDANTIFDTFEQAIEELEWAKNTPSNALLISGPSKTADIEQTLAYGIHGPKELIVLIIDK
ncbi:MAG: lactate utilization protein [Gammaproteobacteria bacterium]|nr:lactate utilization protein [Gammaproteobacteria bacterium]